MQAQSAGVVAVTTGKSRDQLQEQPFTVTGIINNTGSQRRVVNQYFPMNVLLGITKQQFDSDSHQYTSQVTTNPSALCKLAINVCDINGITGSTMRCQTTLTFSVQMYDRKVQNQS